MNVDLNEWRTRLTLEALRTLDEKWSAIIDAAAKAGDEDTAADYGNDLVMLMTLREELEDLAIKTFNPNITTFSREAYTPAPVPNGEQRDRENRQDSSSLQTNG